MVQYIIRQLTAPHCIKDDFVIAVAVAMAYYLSLRASEYVTRTAVPDPEGHQFDSNSIEFLVTGHQNLIPSHLIRTIPWDQIEIVRFTIRHAKNIKHGIPLSFTTQENDEHVIAFLQIVYLWARMTVKYSDDPFLSYRDTSDQLHCLKYITLQANIKACAQAFGFDPAWFNPHCLRMAGPTAARAAGASESEILQRGRWKSLPAALKYHCDSTTSNNNMLRKITDSTLFTGRDIQLTQLLPAKSSGRPTIRPF